jgi:hypothetical protein
MILNAKKLFLSDGLGALLSAFLLGVVLVRFESTFGMPRNVLFFLSITACIFAGYSLINYLLIKGAGKPYLKIIAFANLAYCLLTIGFSIYFSKELTYLGWVYFITEVLVIMALAGMELKVAFKVNGQV